MPPQSPRTSIAFRLGLAYSLFYAIYGITSPYMPILLRSIGYAPSAVGALLAFYELVGIAGPIYLARKADSSGRPKPFLWGSGLTILAGLFLLVAIWRPWATLMALALISVGLKTPIPVLDASIFKRIDLDQAEGRKVPAYGSFRALASVGFVIVAGGVQFIPGFDSSPPWVIALSAGAMVLVYLLGVQRLPRSGGRSSDAQARRRLNLSWIDSTFILGLGVIALGRMAMSSVNSFFSLYLVEELNWPAVGAMNALAAVVEIPMMLIAWRFMKRMSPMAVIGISSAAIILRLMVYALVPNIGGALIGQVLHSVCYGLFQPAAVAFVNLKTPPSERTTGMAIYLGFGISMPLVLGSALGGIVVENLGYRALFALFSLFALGSLSLYRAKAARLDAVR